MRKLLRAALRGICAKMEYASEIHPSGLAINAPTSILKKPGELSFI